MARPAPSIPSIAASTPVLDLDDQDSDSILEADHDGPGIAQPVLEAKPAPPAPAPSMTGTSKFPWQPSPKMAEPMASALRRAAEAAGQVETIPGEPARPAAAPPAPEKRPMSGAMFQAQGHAAGPARAPEKPALVAPPVIEEPVAPKKVIDRETAAAREEKSVIVDTTRDDVPPPSFFPGAYDADDTDEGGGKTKALIIIAAVVLLASSAAYLSWKNVNGSKSSASAGTTAASSMTSSSAAEPAASHPAAPTSEPEETDIDLSPSAPTGHASTPQPATTSKPGTKPSAGVPEASEAEPEVTQRLIVKSDSRHLATAPTVPETDPVPAPSAIGMDTSADTKSLANISSAGVKTSKPTAQLLRVSQGVMEGLVLKRVQPRYPSQALQMRMQGPVQLQATISKTGDIENLKVVSGDAVLSRAAVEAVRQWKYKPYYLNGDPVPIETQILVNFKLPN
jgi:protein TonB